MYVILSITVDILARSKAEMPEHIRFIEVRRGKSWLGGYNYGPYPLHKFSIINKPDPVYPLWTPSCGLDEWRRECYRERRFSDTFAVEYVQQGVFIFQQNNLTMRVNPGEIFLPHLDMDNSIRCETAFAVKKTVIMEGPLLRQILEMLGLTRVDMISAGDHARLDGIIDRLYELNGENTQESRRESSILCYSLLVELAEMITVCRRPPELQRALEYIYNQLESTMSLQDLVRHSGASSATLHRQFRRFMNTSPVAYYLEQKLERAKTLLESHSYSVKEIAELLHYSSPQYFASEFKRKYGFPPKHFKCRRKQGN